MLQPYRHNQVSDHINTAVLNWVHGGSRTVKLFITQMPKMVVTLHDRRLFTKMAQPFWLKNSISAIIYAIVHEYARKYELTLFISLFNKCDQNQ